MMILRRSATALALACAGLMASAYPTAAVGDITFTGPAALGAISIVPTDGSDVSLQLLFPEFDIPRAENLSNGFQVAGRFDFLNILATSVEVTITASRPFSATGDTESTTASLDGLFGVDSVDVVPGLPPGAVAGHLDSFTVTTQVMGLAGSSSMASPGDEDILLAPGFPTGATQVLAGPVSSAPVALSGEYLLVQTVTIRISGLLPLSGVDIDLPTISTVGPGVVPEPTSLALVSLGAIGIGVVALRRRRRPAIDAP